MRDKFLHLGRAGLILLLSASCLPERSVDRQESDFVGYLVLGNGAEHYSFHPNDTLIERTRTDVPLPVLETSDTVVTKHGLNHSCTRYFGSGPYVVFVDRSCTYPARDLHYWAYLVFTADGDDVSIPSRTFSEVVKEKCPRTRDENGRPIVPCRSTDQ
jgi:hypothetical protein